mgnify:CR=1 FL=1
MIKVIELTDEQRLQLEEGFRTGKSHAFRMRCRAILLKSKGLTSKKVGEQTEMTHISVNSWVKRFETEGISGLETRPGRGRKPIMDSSDEEIVRKAIENDRQSVKKAKEAWQQASGKEASASTFRAFFIRLGARYRRIRKRPKGKPSPQLYAYKSEKLQELVKQEQEDLIDLYYGDESHICTEGYVPYGWQFRGEDVYIPSERGLRLNIFGMIDRNNRYEGFSTTENMTADKIADFIDQLSLRIHKNTFVVLDNASVHRCKLMRELRPIWEKRGLFLFFLPPYSPHLNIAETLWRILKGKWLKPVDYISTDSLLYATNRALAALGTELNINFAHVA